MSYVERALCPKKASSVDVQSQLMSHELTLNIDARAELVFWRVLHLGLFKKICAEEY
jgi:hypothetical protein